MYIYVYIHTYLYTYISPLGYGWPPYKGGPLFYAEKYVTLPLLLQRLETFSKIYPNSDYYKPAKLLETMVKV
jgi:hypothetical protein